LLFRRKDQIRKDYTQRSGSYNSINKNWRKLKFDESVPLTGDATLTSETFTLSEAGSTFDEAKVNVRTLAIAPLTYVIS